jgi:hypothetical protein
MDQGVKSSAAVAWTAARLSPVLAVASRGVASLSTKLSVAAVLGITIIPIVPQDAASTLRLPRASVASPPIEMVRPRQVVVDEAEPGENIELVAARRHRRHPSEPEAAKPMRTDSAVATEPDPAPAPPARSESPAAETPEAAQAEPPKPDVWPDGEVIAALRECVKLLGPIGAEVDVSEPIKHDQCGAPAPVMLRGIGAGERRIEINPPAMVNCPMVARLHQWVEKVLQPATEEVFHSRIVRLRNASGYACRNRNGSQSNGDRLSEHALANAIDIAGFVTADGQTIEVARHWGPTARDEREAARLAAEAREGKGRHEPASKSGLAKADVPVRTVSAISHRAGERRPLPSGEREKIASVELQRLGRGADVKSDAVPIPAIVKAREEAQASPEGVFLRRLHKGACGLFGTVLGPEANEAHRDHFHLDLAPRRRSAFCE